MPLGCLLDARVQADSSTFNMALMAASVAALWWLALKKGAVESPKVIMVRCVPWESPKPREPYQPSLSTVCCL